MEYLSTCTDVRQGITHRWAPRLMYR
jgi:hypothetical protein